VRLCVGFGWPATKGVAKRQVVGMDLHRFWSVLVRMTERRQESEDCPDENIEKEVGLIPSLWMLGALREADGALRD
jgi:hypothetical protein